MLERSFAAMLGLAIGDSLGSPVELQSRASIKAKYGTLTHMSGITTDDTAQAIALAEAINPEYDEQQALKNYVDWFIKDGYGIGSNSKYVLEQARQGQDSRVAAQQFLQMRPDRKPSNGGLMRCLPLSIKYHQEPERLAQFLVDDTTLTHAHPKCALTSIWVGMAYQLLLQHKTVNVQHLDQFVRKSFPQEWDNIIQEIEPIKFDSVKDEDWVLNSRSYTVVPMAMLRWCLKEEMSFVEGVVWAANYGGDTDTNAAVIGAALGAKFGLDAIPSEWKNQVKDYDLLFAHVQRLLN